MQLLSIFPNDLERSYWSCAINLAAGTFREHSIRKEQEIRSLDFHDAASYSTQNTQLCCALHETCLKICIVGHIEVVKRAIGILVKFT